MTPQFDDFAGIFLVFIILFFLGLTIGMIYSQSTTKDQVCEKLCPIHTDFKKCKSMEFSDVIKMIPKEN